MTAQIKVRVQRKAIVKLKVLPRFPADVTGEEFIDVEKAAGAFTIGVDYTKLTPATPTSLSTSYVAVLDQALGQYIVTPLSNIGNGGGRTKLTTNTIFNVPADYATVQAALDHTFNDLDRGPYTVSILCAPGTYNEALTIKSRGLGSGLVTLYATTAGTVTLTSSDITISLTDARLAVTNLTLSGGNYAAFVDPFSQLDITTCNILDTLQIRDQGIINTFGNITWGDAGGTIGIHTTKGSQYHAGPGVHTFNVGAAYANYYIGLSDNTKAVHENTFSGSFTGTRAFIHHGADVNTPSGLHPDDYYPGSLPSIWINGGFNDSLGQTIIRNGLQVIAATNRAQPSVPAGSNIGAYVSAADSARAEVFLDSWSAPSSLTWRRMGGTSASPSATPSGAAIGLINVIGYDTTSTYTTAGSAALKFVTTEAFTNTGHGTKAVIAITPTGSTTQSDSFTVDGTGTTLLGLLTLTGGQVAFPATQSASSNPNTLDDYEEGTFTPALSFGGATTGITYNSQTGDYTKIGNLVSIYITMSLSSKGSATGTVNLTGLPFAAGVGTVIAFNLNNGAAAAATQMTGNISTGVSFALLQRFAAGALTNMADTDFANNSVIRLSAVYRV